MEELVIVQQLLFAALEQLQRERLETESKVANLLTTGRKDDAKQGAKLHKEKIHLHLNHAALLLERCKGNRVGGIVNFLTLGENRKAQEACFKLMEQYQAMVRQEVSLADELWQGIV
ncbi:MAG: hypothetical protein JST01_22425 [Cyanobacteria bacterium SZAS TMP-1]|nr:hypothetical protein [Cyanobacteria bacterium SZAS TMP-1]